MTVPRIVARNDSDSRMPLPFVGVLAVRHSGTQAIVRVHWGLLVALATAAFTASCAWHGSAIRQKRAPAGSWERRPARS